MTRVVSHTAENVSVNFFGVDVLSWTEFAKLSMKPKEILGHRIKQLRPLKNLVSGWPRE